MFVLTLSIQLLLCVVTVKCGVLINPPYYVPTQEELDANCSKTCLSEDCLLSDQTDCRRFITCKRNPEGLNNMYHGTLQLCAFGTHWAGLTQHLTCDNLQNVRCDIDYCAGRLIGSNYPHIADNCKTYWRCGDKGPEPKCCKDGEYFDNMELRCMVDIGKKCKHVCPIKKDECKVPGVETEFYDDKNCRTYWNCTDKRAHPTCCPGGEGYDPIKGMCEKNGCARECPPEYQPGICLTGISGYKLHDGRCRTHMKCGPGGIATQFCCLYGNYYNPDTRRCMPKTPDMNCADDCPGFDDACTLMPGPTPDTFMNGNIPMNCSEGLVFKMEICTCGRTQEDSTIYGSCNMEVDIIFDSNGLKRHGSQKVVVNLRGLMLPGATYNQTSTLEFDGNNYYRVMYFKQPFPKFYTNLLYRPYDAASAGKRVLLSNCRSISLGEPSYEVYLQNGRVNFLLVTDATVSGQITYFSANLSLRYQPNAWNRLRILYDGTLLQMLNEVLDDPNASVPSEKIAARLQGEVSVAAEGLDIGKCHQDLHPDPSVLGYTGSIARLQFTKSLCAEILNSFSTAAINAVDVGAGANSPTPA